MFLGLMTDCDYGLLVPADVMDVEVVPYGKKFSEWISWATNVSLAELDLSPKVVSFCCDEQHLRPFVLAPPEVHPFGQSLYTTA